MKICRSILIASLLLFLGMQVSASDKEQQSEKSRVTHDYRPYLESLIQSNDIKTLQRTVKSQPFLIDQALIIAIQQVNPIMVEAIIKMGAVVPENALNILTDALLNTVKKMAVVQFDKETGGGRYSPHEIQQAHETFQGIHKVTDLESIQQFIYGDTGTDRIDIIGAAVASDEQYAKVIRLLLAAGALPDGSQNPTYPTPLWFFVTLYYPASVQELVHAHARLDIARLDQYERTCTILDQVLSCLYSYRHAIISIRIQYIILQHVDKQTVHTAVNKLYDSEICGLRVLSRLIQLLASPQGFGLVIPCTAVELKIIKIILDAIDPESVNRIAGVLLQGLYILPRNMIANKDCIVQITRLLLQAGADVDARDLSGKTVFDYAQTTGKLDLLMEAIAETQAQAGIKIKESELLLPELSGIVGGYYWPGTEDIKQQKEEKSKELVQQEAVEDKKQEEEQQAVSLEEEAEQEAVAPAVPVLSPEQAEEQYKLKQKEDREKRARAAEKRLEEQKKKEAGT